jgi:hypothetical protein
MPTSANHLVRRNAQPLKATNPQRIVGVDFPTGMIVSRLAQVSFPFARL